MPFGVFQSIDKRREFENIASMIKSTHIAATYFWLFR